MEPKQIQNLMHGVVPLLKTMDFRINKTETGYVECEMGGPKVLLNHMGTFYAGAVFSLGEAAGGVLIITHEALRKYLVIAKAASIEYLKPVKKMAVATGRLPVETVEAMVAEFEKTQRAATSVDMEIHNENGDLAARMKIEYVMKNY